MSTPDPTPLGLPYAIGDVVLTTLRTEPVLIGKPVAENPSSPADIVHGDRVLIFRDAGDSLVEQTGAAQKRSYTFRAGSMARTKTARLDAHTDYRALRRAIRAALQRFRQANVNVQSLVRETDVQFTFDDEGVDGALVLGTFVVDYRDSD